MELRDKKLFLLDMDGTLYIDEYLFPRAKDFLNQVKAGGKAYAYLSNNSSRGKDAYVSKMKRLGITAFEDEFLTSVDATIDYLKANYSSDARFFALGTNTFSGQLKAEGLNVVTALSDEDIKNIKNKQPLDNPIDAVVLSYDTEITFKKIEDFTALLNTGVDYVATHPDDLCPTWYGNAVDVGCYIEMFKTATLRVPYIVGKPQPDMALSAMKRFGCTKEETCFIGDRLTTDILCGINAGIDTVFVLSGDHNREDIDRFNIHPAYIFNDIGEVCDEIK